MVNKGNYTRMKKIDSMGNYGSFGSKKLDSVWKVLVGAFLSPFMSIKSIFDHEAHNIHNIK